MSAEAGARTGPAMAGRFPRVTAVAPATFGQAVRSEWTKVRTSRPAVVAVLVAVVLTVLVGAVFGRGAGLRYPSLTDAGRAAFDPAWATLHGCLFAQFAFGLLGVRMVTTEYATGMIRTSLAAVPRRGRLLAAKAVVCAAVAFAAGGAAAFAAFFLGQRLIEGLGAPAAALGDPAALRAVTGAGLYLTLIALAGVALGFLTRATASACALLFTAILMVPVLGALLPRGPWHLLAAYWPASASIQIMAARPGPRALPPWAGLGLLSLSVALALAAALASLRRRDA